jgi:PKD repeat protein/lysophospholipase L1-like esterase
MRVVILVVLVTVAAFRLLVPAQARADALPPPSPTGWTEGGTATFDSSGQLQLTSADQGYADGSSYWPTAISPASLTATFDETISGSGNTADGLAFDLLDASGSGGAGPSTGDPGAALGFGFENRGRAVAFVENAAPWSCYPSDHFLGIADGTENTQCPTLNYLTTASGIPPLVGSTHHVTVAVTFGSQPRIAVTFDGVQEIDYPDADTATPFPSSVYVGFSGASGIGTETATVSNVQITYTPMSSCGSTTSGTDCPPTAGRYVALGDSYSAGEGAPPFIPPSASGSDQCHRSADAYPQVLVRDFAGGEIPSTVDFWACSGAIIPDFYNDNHLWGEPPQLQQLMPADATLVTLSIGGNDIGFSNIGATCLKVNASIFEQLNPSYKDNCRDVLDSSTMAAINSLGSGTTLDNGQGLQSLFADIRAAAPSADVYVMGYPRILPSNPTSDCQAQAYREDGRKATGSPFDQNATDGIIGIETRIAQDDVVWLNKVVSRLNGAIASQAAAAGFHYVDVEDAFAGHDICSNSTDPSDRPWAHGLVLLSDTNDPSKNPSAFSFHPNSYGQAAMATALDAAINSGTVEIVLPNQTGSASIGVPPAQGLLNVNTSWPGSTVVTSLVSPSGAVFNASTPGISHSATATTENFVIKNPEPGTWTVQLYGANVHPGGEPVRVTSTTTPNSALAPVSIGSATAVDGIAPASIRFDGSHSMGTAAPIVGYTWNFGDGSPTFGGATVRHAYPKAGTYIATLTVTDAAGRTDTSQQKITVFATDQRPTASLEVYRDPSAHRRIYYDASGSNDRDGQPVKLALNFGDGSRSPSATGFHTFRFNGMYKMTLVVADPSHLTARASATIVVDHARNFITRLRLTRRRFGHTNGTVITYYAQGAGLTTFKLLRRVSGVRIGKRCVASARRQATKHSGRCSTLRAVGSFTQKAHRGRNVVRFVGKLGRRTLRADRYELLVVASRLAFSSTPIARSFSFTG